ncbi:MAG: hypothetical protein E7167_01270 [Firmicutes bacterium]|nr:hypothetical protein [Bacillota bacterium]
MYALTARFLNPSGKLSEKSYIYRVSDKIFSDINDTEYFAARNRNDGKWVYNFPTWEMTCESKSRYHNFVIFTNAEEISDSAYPDRPKIKKAELRNKHKINFDEDDTPLETVAVMEVSDFLDFYSFDDIVEDNRSMTPAWFGKGAPLTCNCANESSTWYVDEAYATASSAVENPINFYGTTATEVDYKLPETISTKITVDPDSLKISSDIDPSVLKIQNDGFWSNVAISAETAADSIKELKEAVDNLKLREEKRNMNMKSIMKDFNFGKASGVKMSMYGPAFQSMDNSGTSEWIALEKKTGDWVDVTALMFDMDIPFYQMPVPKDKVTVNDFIKHNGTWVRVIDFDENTAYPIVEDIFNKEQKTIIPTKSPFGFDFYTKLVNIMGDMSFNTSKDQPFGNMLPFLMLNNGSKMTDMLPMMMLMNGGEMDMSNPMMMFALMGDNKMNDMLPFMMMMNMNKEKK